MDKHLSVSRRDFLKTTLVTGVGSAVHGRATQAPFHRQVISLNGTWKLYFDRKGRWQKSDWITDFLSPELRRVRIPWDEMRKQMESQAIDFQVPATWEEYQPGTVGEGWYWRRITVPESFSPALVRLRFNAVRYGAEVFLDGNRVALYLGGFTPFEANVSTLVKPGSSHELVVHVVNPGGGLAGNWDKLFFEDTQIPQSHSFGGIWQDATMLITAPLFIRDVFVIPHLDTDSAELHVTVDNRTREGQRGEIYVRACLDAPSSVVAGEAEKTVQVGAGRSRAFTVALPLRPCVLWEPANPARYRLDIALRAAGAPFNDSYELKFGMREFTAWGRYFYLNGRRFLVKSAINHQYYPITVGCPPTIEFARKEIRVALASGMNMMHIHRQIGHPWLFELADELGLLLYEEIGGVIFNRSQQLDYPGIRLLIRQLSDLVPRDRNHPSLVAWGMSNENILNASVYSYLMNLTRRLDPTRVVCDNSGHGLQMFLPYQTIPHPWRDLHYYPPAPVEQATYEVMQHFGDPSSYGFWGEDGREILPPMPQEGPQIIGEVGYGGLPNLPRAVREFAETGKPSIEGANWKTSLQCMEWGFKRYELEESFESVTRLCKLTEQNHAEALEDLLQALRTNPYNSGYAVSCFHDLAAWYCGLTDIFRNRKISSERLPGINAPLYLAIEVDRAPASTGQEVCVRCRVVNEGVVEGPADLTLSIAGPDSEQVLKKVFSLNIDPKQVVNEACETSLKLGGATGYYTVRAELASNFRKRASNARRIFAVRSEEITWPTEPVWLYDRHQQLLPFFAGQKIPHRLWSRGASAEKRPILVGEVNLWYYNEHKKEIEADLSSVLEQCRQGSVAAFLIGSIGGRDDGLVGVLNALKLFPGPMAMVETAGNFRGCFHLVKTHPVFRGLPQKTCMGREYRNVIAHKSLDGFEGETVVACNMNASWWGTDVGIVRVGLGALMLLTMRVVQHLGTDPVAALILSNAANWQPNAPQVRKGNPR